MINIEIENGPVKTKRIHADTIDEGSIFRDSDGDLYIKASGGAVRLSLEDNAIVIYESDDLDSCPFLRSCEIVKGNIEIKIILE